MYRRLLLFLFFMSIILLNGILGPVHRRYRGWAWDAIWIFMTVLWALLVYGVVRLALLVRRLGKTGQKS